MLGLRQPDLNTSTIFSGLDYYDLESMVHTDTRSFILKKPKLSEEIMVPQNLEVGKRASEALQALSGRLIQTR